MTQTVGLTPIREVPGIMTIYRTGVAMACPACRRTDAECIVFVPDGTLRALHVCAPCLRAVVDCILSDGDNAAGVASGR